MVCMTTGYTEAFSGGAESMERSSAAAGTETEILTLTSTKLSLCTFLFPGLGHKKQQSPFQVSKWDDSVSAQDFSSDTTTLHHPCDIIDADLRDQTPAEEETNPTGSVDLNLPEEAEGVLHQHVIEDEVSKECFNDRGTDLLTEEVLEKEMQNLKNTIATSLGNAVRVRTDSTEANTSSSSLAVSQCSPLVSAVDGLERSTAALRNKMNELIEEQRNLITEANRWLEEDAKYREEVANRRIEYQESVVNKLDEIAALVSLR